MGYVKLQVRAAATAFILFALASLALFFLVRGVGNIAAVLPLPRALPSYSPNNTIGAVLDLRPLVALGSGVLLAVARAAGETAPLLFTTSIFSNFGIATNPSQALPNIPVTIFTLSESPSPQDHAQAWAASLVLVGFVLIVSIVARGLNERSRRKLGS